MKKTIRRMLMGFIVTYSFGLGLMAVEADQLIKPNPTVVATQISIPSLPDSYVHHTYEDILWLARNIYFESRGESREGRLAVAFVTLNRMFHPEFPNSIKNVVLQKKFHPVKKKTICQFSWVCERSPDSIYELKAWNEALTMARQVLSGEVENPIGEAIFFRRALKNKNYNDNQKVIDQHVFSQQPIS